MRTGGAEILARKEIERGEPTSAARWSLRMGLLTNEQLLVGTRETSRDFGGNMRALDLMAYFSFK